MALVLGVVSFFFFLLGAWVYANIYAGLAKLILYAVGVPEPYRNMAAYGVMVVTFAGIGVGWAQFLLERL